MINAGSALCLKCGNILTEAYYHNGSADAWVRLKKSGRKNFSVEGFVPASKSRSDCTGFSLNKQHKADVSIMSDTIYVDFFEKGEQSDNKPFHRCCPECNGSGAAKGTSPETCPDCHGSGSVTTQQRTPFGIMQSRQPCSRCGGKGKIVKEPCKHCNASGRVSVSKKYEVNVPAGIDDDQSIALRGLGDAGANGGPAGDLIVNISVRPDEVFERDRFDVYVTVPITYAQAVMGAEVVVPTVDGKVQYTVPEGTQPGTTFRLRGKGIQYLNGRGRGDQYVRVNVEIPRKLNKEQRKALEAFEQTMKDDNYEQRKGFAKRLREMFGDK